MRLGRSSKSNRLLILSMLLLAAVFFSLLNTALAKDENAFTEEVGRSFLTAMPEARVSIKGPLTLSVGLPGDVEGWNVNLDRVWDYCTRNASDCQKSIAAYVRRTVEMVRQQSLPIQREKVMAVIRSTRAIQSVRDQLSQGSIEPVAELVAGDLWLMCVLDGEPAARVLSNRDLAKLGLSKVEVVSLAKNNLTTYLPQISGSVNISPDSGFGFVGGDAYYGASQLLLHDQWAELARAMKGQLLVTVPDGGIIFFADSAKPIAVQALSKASSDTARKSERPISPAILAWTPRGWQEWKR